MNDGAYTEEQVLSLARRAYKEGSANFDIVPEKCALLVIDMQDEFVNHTGHQIGFRKQPGKFRM